jgi:hypothetical protein
LIGFPIFPAEPTFFGWHGAKPLHVVAALEETSPRVYIITAYEPDLEHFENDFRTRRKK